VSRKAVAARRVARCAKRLVGGHWRQLWGGLGLEVPYADLTCDLSCSVTRPVLHVRGAPVSESPVPAPVFNASFSWMRLHQETGHVALIKRIVATWGGRQIR
jgi:hypothetical protein